MDESLQKFQEYENALDLISSSLDKLEPEIANEQGVSPQSVEEAKNHQNIIRVSAYARIYNIVKYIFLAICF